MNTLNPISVPEDGIEFQLNTRLVPPAAPCDALQKLRDRSNVLRIETNANISFMTHGFMMFHTHRTYIINEINEMIYDQ